MDKIAKFFRKHAKLIMMSVQALLLVTSVAILTYVSLGIWTNDKQSQTLVNRETNPSEKYFTYYAAVRNIASEKGYDYYPLSTIPKELISSVEGLAVARYEGFETTVQIPAYPRVLIDGEIYNAEDETDSSKILPVIHVLYGYYNTADNLGSNGLAYNSRITTLILPETLTYVYEGAFAQMSSLSKVNVRGTRTFEYNITCGYLDDGVKKFKDQWEIYADNTYNNLVDTLILGKSEATGKNYYISATDYQQYEIDDDTMSFTYTSESTQSYFSLTTEEAKLYKIDNKDPYIPSRVYFEEGAFTTNNGDAIKIVYQDMFYVTSTGSDSSSKGFTITWEDIERSANAAYYTFDLITGTETYGEDAYMFVDSEHRLTAYSSYNQNSFIGYFVPAREISNCVILFTLHYYEGTESKTSSFTVNLSGYTFNPGVKYKITHDGGTDITGIKYNLQYTSENGSLMSEDLVLDTYIKAKDNASDPDYYIANEQTYEKYIKKNNLILSNYSTLNVYEVIFRPQDSSETAIKETLISSFDLEKTNASYSSDNYAFEITFSPTTVTSSIHYYSDKSNSNILNVSTVESLLNAEKVYYLNEVVRIQNEELIVYYHNIDNAGTVFISGYTPISNANQTYAYYNGKEEPRNTRYEDCVMQSAKGSIVGLYDANGKTISKVYDKNGEQLKELYASSSKALLTKLTITSDGLFDSLYDENGTAVTELYADATTSSKITELYDKSGTKVNELSVKIYDDSYLEYHFDLRFGSPTHVKFSTGTKRDTVLPDNVVATNSVDNNLYTIYYEDSKQTNHTLNIVDGTITKSYNMSYYTDGETYLYYYKLAASTTATFSFDSSSSQIGNVKDYTNRAYVAGNWENVYYLESLNDELWHQAGAIMQAHYGSSSNNLTGLARGINIPNSRTTIITVPYSTHIEFLRCDPNDITTVWNRSAVVAVSIAGSTYRITAWGEPCTGEFVNNANYLVLDDYYEGTMAFAPVSQTNDKPNGFDEQFTIGGLSLSAGTKIYGAYLPLSGNTLYTNALAYDETVDPNYTSDNNYIQFDSSTNTYNVKKNCKVDVYYKFAYTSDTSYRYGFWFNVNPDETDFKSSGFDFNEENYNSADSFVLAGSKGLSTTKAFKFGSGTDDLQYNAVNFLTVTEISNTGDITYDIAKISGSNYLAVELPDELVKYNNGEITFYGYFASLNANYDDVWNKLHAVSASSNGYTTYIVETPSLTSYYTSVVIYGFEPNTRKSTTSYLYQSSSYRYYQSRNADYRGSLIRVDASLQTNPKITYTLHSTSTGFYREGAFGDSKYKNYYFLYPSENMLYALKKGLITNIDIDISGSVKYFTPTVNYTFGKKGTLYDSWNNVYYTTETGSFRGNNSGTIRRFIETESITSEELLTGLSNGMYAVRMPISAYDNSDAIIDEAHTVQSFVVNFTFTYADGTSETLDLINIPAGGGVLNNYLRNQYLNLDCNLEYFNTTSITRTGAYDLSSNYGLYFDHSSFNNYDYYIVNSSGTKITSSVIGDVLFVSQNNLSQNQNYIIKSDLCFETKTNEAIFDIINSYKLERNNANTSYEEYYVLSDLTQISSESKFIVSGIDKDNYTAGSKIKYYGDSNSNDSLGFMSLDAKKQIILFTPNQSSSYKTISYGIYNEAGALIGKLAYDADLTLENGYQTFTASVPVLSNKTNYFYIMSLGNNPRLVGRYLATNDGNLTYISSYSAKISTAASASGDSVNASVSKDYTIDSFKSDEMYALALKNADGSFTQHYPYYLVGSFNNWNLDNTYGLTFDSTNEITYDANSSVEGYDYKLGSTKEKYKYYTITNVYLRAGDSYRISNVTSYYEIEGFTSAIQGEENIYGDSYQYLALATNGYTINVTKTGYYDIVFEEYILQNLDLNGGTYGYKYMYRTGAKLNNDNLYSIDLFFQNDVDWDTVKIVGYNSTSGRTLLNDEMIHYAGVINGKSNWYQYTYQYRSNDDIPDYIYFEGTGASSILRTTDLNFTITSDAEKSGQIFFTPKMSNNELIVNVDNTYFFIDASSITNFANYRYAVYFSNSTSDYSWVEFKQYDASKPGIYYAKLESSYANYQIAVLNNRYSGFTLDETSNMVKYLQKQSLKVDNAKNLFVINSVDDSTKAMTFASYTSTIFVNSGNISLGANEKLYAIFQNDATKEEVLMQSSDQNLFYAFNLNPSFTKVSFKISDGSSTTITEAITIENNLYSISMNNGILSATGANHTNFESYLYNDGTPYLYYIRTSDNWNANVGGLVYDKSSGNFVIEGLSLEKGVGIKLFDNSGNAYMISSTYQNWKYDANDLYSLIVDVTTKYTIVASASVGYVTASITEYNVEYLKSFNIATAVVYDDAGIVASYNMIYTSNSSVIYNNMIYLKTGYRVYIYEANKEQYTYEYRVTSGIDGYYKMYVALKQIDNEKAYGWSDALNASGQTVNNVVILVDMAYRILNFTPGAIYDGTYINLTNPSYRVDNNGVISYEKVTDGEVKDTYIEENDYPVESYVQNKAFYAVLRDQDGNRINEYDIPLTWSQTTNVESKNANYTAYISVPERDVVVNIYDENNAPVGEMTIAFPGRYELHYSNLYIYSSSNSSGKNNVMAYRLYGEGSYTLWIDANKNANLDNTYNSNYEEYAMNSSLNVSENIDLILKPFYVRDAYGNIITTINAVTLFDYEEIATDEATTRLADGEKIYTYSAKEGYQLVSSIDTSSKYYKLEIKRVTDVPSGVYEVVYSTDNRRRTDDNYLVFTYVILKKIPAVKVQMFYIQSDVYNPDATYYQATSVYTKYTGNGSDLSNVYELVEAKEFDVTGTYFVLEPTNGGYVLNQVKIDTFEKDTTYYTFTKASSYEANKSYYTYLYNKVSVDQNTDFSSGNYFIYQQATSYEDGKQYYQLINGEYVPTGFNPLNYNLYTMEEVNSKDDFDPATNVYYYQIIDGTNVSYTPVTDYTVKDNYYSVDSENSFDSSENIPTTSVKYFMYNTTDESYTLVDDLIIKSQYFTRALLLRTVNDTVNQRVFEETNGNYAYTDKYYVKENTYFLGVRVADSSTYKAGETYFYLTATGSTVNASENGLELKKNQYYTLEGVKEGDDLSNMDIFVKNGTYYEKADSETGIPITDTTKTYYKRCIANNAADYVTIDNDNYKGYYENANSTATTTSPKLGVSAFLETAITGSLYTGGTVSSGTRLATTDANYTVLVKTTTQLYYGQNNNYRLNPVSQTTSGYTTTYYYYYDENITYYESYYNGWFYDKYSIDDLALYNETTGDVVPYSNNIVVVNNMTDQKGQTYNPQVVYNILKSSTKSYQVGTSATNGNYQLSRYYFETISNDANNKDELLFDKTYYYYKKITSYNGTSTTIDSSMDLVNGLYKADGTTVRTVDPTTKVATIPSINDDVYTVTRVTGTRINARTTYYTDNQNYRIVINSSTTYYFRYNNNNNTYLPAEYYDPSITYYTRSGNNGNYRQATSLNYSVVDVNGNTVSASIYTVTKVNNGTKYSESGDYYRTNSVDGTDVISVTTNNGYWNSTTTNYNVSYTGYYVQVADDVKFDKEYLYDVEYLTPNGSGFDVIENIEKNIDYSLMFTPKVATYYDQTTHQNGGYYQYVSGSVSRLVQIAAADTINFNRVYYYKGQTAADGYYQFDSDTNQFVYYDKDQTLIANAVMFDTNNALMETAKVNLAGNRYYTFSNDDNIYNSSMEYYVNIGTATNEIYQKVDNVSFAYTYYPSTNFTAQAGNKYDENLKYVLAIEFNGQEVIKYIGNKTPYDIINTTGMYKGILATNYDRQNKTYYYDKEKTGVLYPFVLNDEFTKNVYYYFEQATSYQAGADYYERDHYRTLITSNTSIPKYYNGDLAQYISDLCKNGLAYTLDDVTYTYGDTFDSDIYQNDGYWLTQNNTRFSKADFHFNFDNGTKYYSECNKVTSYDASKADAYYQITQNGLGIVVPSKEEFEANVQNKKYYGLYNYYLAEGEDNALPSYLEIGGVCPLDTDFAYWIDHIYTEYPYMNYAEVMSDHKDDNINIYNDSDVINVSYNDNLSFFPTFSEATFKLYVQIGSGYTVLDSEGKRLNDAIISSGNNVINFQVEIAEGYVVDDTFRVYFVDSNGDVLQEWDSLESSYSYTVVPLKTVYLYVSVAPKTYTVTLDAPETSLDKTKVTATYGNYVNFGLPVREGYTFLYWYDKNTGTVYSDNTGRSRTRWNLNSNITLSAAWDLLYETSISYVDVNGELLKDSADSSVYTAGDTVRINIINFLGYEFSSIEAFDADGNRITLSKYTSTYSFSMPEKNVFIKVVYKLVQYQINYNLDGGRLPDGVTNKSTYTIKDSFSLNNPIKEGYIFVGWSGSGINGTTQFVEVAVNSTGNRIYSATWELIETEINYIFNVDDVINPNKEIISILDGDYTLSEPTKEDYQFMGWYRDSKFTNEFTGTLSYSDRNTEGKINLYGKFELIQYVFFDIADINSFTITINNDKLGFGTGQVTINLVDLLKNKKLFAYTYFFNENGDLQAWADVSIVSDNLYWTKVPTNAYTKAILVITTESFDLSTTNVSWDKRVMQTDNLVIGRDSALTITNGLFVLSGAKENGDYILLGKKDQENVVTPSASQDSVVKLHYTGSPLFDEAVRKSGLSYTAETHRLKITYRSDVTSEETVIVNTLDGSSGLNDTSTVSRVGTYIIRIFENDTNEESLIVLRIVKNVYDVSGITMTDSLVKYDGTNKTISIEGVLPAGLTVKYTYRALGSKDSSDVAPINVGTYVVTAHFESNNSESYEDVADMEAYLIIYNENNYYYVGSKPIYFGLYVNERLTALLSKGDNSEYVYTNLTLNAGDKVYIMDSEGTRYVSWTNADIPNAQPFNVKIAGEYSFYFNTVTIKTSVTMPVTSVSDSYYITYTYNGITYKHYLYDDGYRQSGSDDPQKEQYSLELELPGGAVLNGYYKDNNTVVQIESLENYDYFGLATGKITDGVTILYTSSYRVHIKVYENQKELFIGFTTTPIYVKFNKELDVSSANVYYWTDGNSGKVAWPGASLTMLSDYAQIDDNYNIYIGYVDAYADFIIFNYVDSNGNRVQSNNLNYKYTDFINVFIIDKLDGNDSTISYESRPISTREKNEYTFDASKYKIIVYDLEGVTATRTEGNKFIVEVKKALTGIENGVFQSATFRISYCNKTTNEIGEFVIKYESDGTNDYPILINDEDDFYQYVGSLDFAKQKGLYLLQTSSITLSDAEDDYNKPYNKDLGFNNIYLGQNYEIRYQQEYYNITSRQDANSTAQYNGVFGYIGYDGVIKDLKVIFRVLNGRSSYGYVTAYYVGSVASFNDGLIQNVTAYATDKELQTATLVENFNVAVNNVRYFGGLVGYNNGRILNSYNQIGVTAWNWGASDSWIVGGIAGYNNGEIADSINYAAIIVNSNNDRSNFIGGIAGLNAGVITNSQLGTNGSVKTNNKVAIINEISTNVIRHLPVTIENDWFFVSESVTDVKGILYRIESNLRVDYYINNDLYTSRFYNQNDLENGIINIDLLDNDAITKISLSRALIITTDNEEGRFVYHYNKDESGYNFTKISQTQFVGFPANTYEIFFDRSEIESNNDGVYYYVTKSATYYETSQNENDLASWSRYTLSSSAPSSMIKVNGLDVLFTTATEYKVIAYDKDGVALGINTYKKSDSLIYTYPNQKTMLFANYIKEEGSSSIDDSYNIITVDLAGNNKDLFFYKEGDDIKYSFGYDPSQAWNTTTLSLINMLTKTFASGGTISIRYENYDSASENVTLITTAQYDINSSVLEMSIRMLQAEANCNRLTITVNGDETYEIIVMLAGYTGNEKLYLESDTYTFLADYDAESESTKQKVINQYLDLLYPDYSDDVVVKHYDASGNIFKIDAYANNETLANKYALYAGHVLTNNIESNLIIYPDTNWLEIKQLNAYHSMVKVEEIATDKILYIYNPGEDHYVDGKKFDSGIKTTYLTSRGVSSTRSSIKVFNEVNWYANVNALMKVTYYDKDINIIGFRTYDVLVSQDIDLLEGTTYLEFCRLCQGAEYNFKSIDISSFDSGENILIAGDNNVSKVTSDYLPIEKTVSLYNYVTGWNNGTLKIEYYSSLSGEAIKVIENVPYDTRVLNIYAGTKALKIYHLPEVTEDNDEVTYSEPIVVNSIDNDKNLYLVTTNDGANNAIWSKPLAVTTSAYIPVVFSAELTYWSYIVVDYYTNEGILITSIRYTVNDSAIAYIKNTEKMVVKINGNEEESLTIANISLEKTLRFQLNSLSFNSYRFVDNNANNLSETTRISFVNTVLWWNSSSSLTKVYYYNDDILLTINVFASTAEQISLPIYEGTTRLRIVRLDGFNENNTIEVTAIYPSKILKLYSPSASVANATWEAKPLAADETVKYLYFNHKSLANVTGVNLVYVDSKNVTGTLTMELDSKSSGYYRINWDTVVAMNSKSIGFEVIYQDMQTKTYGNIVTASIDINKFNVFSASDGIFNELYNEYQALYLNVARIAPWNDYYVTVSDSTGSYTAKMTYLDDKGVYAATVLSKYLTAVNAKVEFHSSKNEYFYISSGELVYDTEKQYNTYVLYGVGVIVGLKDSSGNATPLVVNGSRVDATTNNFFDITQYTFATIGAWTNLDEMTTAKLDELFDTALNDIGANKDEIMLNGNLQFYSYSVGAMNGWTVGSYLYGESYIGQIDGRYVFYNSMILSDASEHKVQLSNSWDRSFSDDNNTADLEYSLDDTYVMSKFDGQQNIASSAGKYIIVFEVKSGELTADNGIKYNESGIHVISLKNKYTVTWVIGEETIEETYSEGETPTYKGDEPTKESSQKYDYSFASWSPSIEEVKGNATYEAIFTATLRNYTVTVIYPNESKTYKVPYGTRISNDLVTSLDYALAGYYYDDKYTQTANDNYIREDTTLYAKVYKDGVYLIGTIDNITDWQSQNYQFTYYSDTNTYQLKISLLTLDEVRIYNFAAKNGSTYGIYYNNFVLTGLDAECAMGTEKANKNNLIIKQAGNYTFNLKWDNEGKAYIEVSVTHNVSFVTNQEDLSADSILDVAIGGKITLPNLTKDNLIFVGWFTDKDLTNEFTEDSEVTEDLILYAKWISPSNGSDTNEEWLGWID